jgi:hypothetical protein
MIVTKPELGETQIKLITHNVVRNVSSLIFYMHAKLTPLNSAVPSS